jgi:tetratricopeptide (TPR) repeat protein
VLYVCGCVFGGAIVLVGCSTRPGAEADYEYPEQAEHLDGLQLDCLSYDNPETKKEVSTLWAVIQRNSTDARERFELARILLRHQYPKPAITLLSHPSCKKAQSPQYYLLLAHALVCDAPANQPRSTALLEEGVCFFPENAQMHVALGHAYNKENHSKEALVEFGKALNLKAPVNVLLSAHLGRAAAFRKQSDEPAAQQELARAKRIYPGLSEQLNEVSVTSQLPPLEPSDYFGYDGIHPVPRYRAQQVKQEIERMKKEQQ